MNKYLRSALLGGVRIVKISVNAEAAYFITITETVDASTNLRFVRAIGSGSIDTDDLTPSGSISISTVFSYVDASNAELVFEGIPLFGDGILYSGISGPKEFGSGTDSAIDSSGRFFMLNGSTGTIGVLSTYVSGSLMNSFNTWYPHDLFTLGLEEGVYTWTWGTGENADYIKLTIGTATTPVPEPTTLALLGVALIGLGILGRGKALRP